MLRYGAGKISPNEYDKTCGQEVKRGVAHYTPTLTPERGGETMKELLQEKELITKKGKMVYMPKINELSDAITQRVGLCAKGSMGFGYTPIFAVWINTQKNMSVDDCFFEAKCFFRDLLDGLVDE